MAAKEKIQKIFKSVWIKDVVIVFLVSRILLLFFGEISNQIFPNYTGNQTTVGNKVSIVQKIDPKDFFRLNEWYQFDTGFYDRLVTRGYDHYRINEPHPAANWPFFPLYPLLVKLAWLPVQAAVAPFIVGMALSNVFFYFGLVFLYKFAKLAFSSEVAQKAIVYISIFPATFFFSAMYTESLFFMLTAAVMYFAKKEKWFAAALAASLGAITRNIGVFLPLIILFEILKKDRYSIKEIIRDKRLLFLLITPIPFLIFLWYMQGLTGSFFAPFSELSNWGRASHGIPFFSYANYLKDPYFYIEYDLGLMSFIFGIFGLALSLLSFKKLGLSFGLFATFTMLLPLTAGDFASLTRYVLSATPLFVTLGAYGSKRKNLDFAIMMFFALWLAIYFFGFVNNYYYAI